MSSFQIEGTTGGQRMGTSEKELRAGFVDLAGTVKNAGWQPALRGDDERATDGYIGKTS